MKSLRSLIGTLRLVAPAARVSTAVENGRRPSSRDLRRLGIDPECFTSIGHG